MTTTVDEYSDWKYEPGMRIVELMVELEDLEWKIPFSYFRAYEDGTGIILEFEHILKAFEDWNGVCLVDRALEVFKEIYKDKLIFVMTGDIIKIDKQ